jgi:hypothetical protein
MSRVEQILKDPDSVAFYGELLTGLTVAEVLQIHRAVQDEKLRHWAWVQRNQGIPADPRERTPAPKRTPARGYVYLCRNNRNGLIKIGFSKEPKYREVTLQSEDPDVEFIHVRPADRGLERCLHQIFAAKRRRGEWFELSDEDVAHATANPFV